MVHRAVTLCLAVAIAFAVGVCPCGFEHFVRAAMPSVSRSRADVAMAAQPGGCCEKTGRESDQGQSHPERCSLRVSGDIPLPHMAVPPHDLVYTSAILFAPLGLCQLGTAELRSPLPIWLPPPPTLVGLSCCFNV